MLNPGLINQLQKEINQSGYPVELDVVDTLRKAKYLVSPNLSFRSNGNSVREIDAVAFSRVQENDQWPFGSVGNILVVECKRQKEKPWVFFEEVSDPSAGLGLGTEMEVLTELQYASPYTVLTACMNTALSGHHLNSYLPTARTYFEAFRKPGHENVIHKAILSLWHGLSFARSWFNINTGEITHQKENPLLRTLLLQGVLVFDGQLVLASKTDDGFSLSACNHLVLRTLDRVTQKSTSVFGIGEEVIIDVVTLENFPSYLNLIGQNVTMLKRHLKEQLDAGWIINNKTDRAQ